MGYWLTLGSPQPWPIMQTQWDDTTFTTQSARFYRVVAVQPATRGKLLSSALLTNYSATSLSNMLFQYYGVPMSFPFGVNWYQLVYETIDPIGARTVASGGLFLPQFTALNAPLFSFSHGTTVQTNEVASTLSPSSEYPAGLLAAGNGFATVLADLLGLGSSPGLHPYLHARSEATASVDMLRAARNFCASNNFGLNGQLFIMGYSQGGHTCMALHRELETYHAAEFTITASAPMSGPYRYVGHGVG